MQGVGSAGHKGLVDWVLLQVAHGCAMARGRRNGCAPGHEKSDNESSNTGYDSDSGDDTNYGTSA